VPTSAPCHYFLSAIETIPSRLPADFDQAYQRFYRAAQISEEHEYDDLAAYREHSELLDMSEEEAVDIAVDFGTAYADCNDERLVFKPFRDCQRTWILWFKQ